MSGCFTVCTAILSAVCLRVDEAVFFAFFTLLICIILYCVMLLSQDLIIEPISSEDARDVDYGSTMRSHFDLCPLCLSRSLFQNMTPS